MTPNFSAHACIHPSPVAALALRPSGACQRYQSPPQPPGPIVFGTEFEGNSQPVSFRRLTERHTIGTCSDMLISGNRLLVIRCYIALICDIMLNNAQIPCRTLLHRAPGGVGACRLCRPSLFQQGVVGAFAEGFGFLTSDFGVGT